MDDKTSKSSNSNSKKKKILIGTAALCGALLIGGAAFMASGIRAYLTDVDQAVNTFTIGEVTIDTLEPNYPGNGSDEVKDLVPLQEVRKDPCIKNTGKNKIVVFSQIDIPMANIVVADEDGNKKARANIEIFNFRTTTGSYNSYHNEKWIQLSSEFLTDDDEHASDRAAATKVRYIFGYNTAVQEDETTLPVFDVVRLCNAVEDNLDNSLQNIIITSYAIQADNIAGITDEDWTETMDAYKLNTIFDTYMHQSADKDPSSADNENNQTLIGTTLNVTMTVQNTHLRLNSGREADKHTTTLYNVAYTGPNEKPVPTFMSSNTSVVTVDQNGNIDAVGVGKATITMSAVNPDTGKTATASVTVSVKDMNAGEH